MQFTKASFWNRTLISRLLILTFMTLVGFSLAKGIQTQSVIAILLSVVSLGAAVYFLYLLAKMNQDHEEAI
ncbi:MAG: hypothetical protein H7Y42_08810 [Chitinophagaceae bacterium]|nr:hypothetical protein [Chitinophagaceae bacterium]